MNGSDFFKNIDAGIEEFSAEKTENVLKALESLPPAIKEDDLADTSLEDTEKNKDARFAIENLKATAKITDAAIRQVFQLGASSDQARAWEVLAGLLKTQVDAAKTLHDISMKSAESPKQSDGPKIGNQTNIFVGSTEDLFDMMEEYDNSKMKVIDAD